MLTDGTRRKAMDGTGHKCTRQDVNGTGHKCTRQNVNGNGGKATDDITRCDAIWLNWSKIEMWLISKI